MLLKRRLLKHGAAKGEIRAALVAFGNPVSFEWQSCGHNRTYLATLALHHCHSCEGVIDLRCTSAILAKGLGDAAVD